MSFTSALEPQKPRLGSPRAARKGAVDRIATPQTKERVLGDPRAISSGPAISVVLTNRWATFRCSPELLTEIKPLFSYPVPGAQFSEAFKCGSWDGRKNLMARGRVASGLFLEMCAELKEKYRLRVTDHREPPKHKDLPALNNARSYQTECVDAMNRCQCGGIVLVATGAGKTFTTGDYLRQLDGYAVFVVDELTLWRQAKEELEKVIGEEIGLIGNGQFAPRRVTVATVQTLHKHRDKAAFRKWAEKLDAAVIDEVHVAINKRHADVIAQLKPKVVFGLTATLELEKPHVKLPVTAMCGPVIYRYPIQEGVKEGHLSKGKVIHVLFRDPLRGDAPGYHSIANGQQCWIPGWSKSAKYRYHVVLNKARNNLVEKLARETVRRGRFTVVMVERLDHLRVLSQRLRDVKHKVMSGAQSMEERFCAKSKMDEGKLPLIIANRVFGRGIDISRVGAIIDATGLPGRNSAIQRYGRGTRKVSGKADLWYLNIADRASPFEGAAFSREKALAELGAETVRIVWSGRELAALDATMASELPDPR